MMEKFRPALYSLQSAVEKLKGGAVIHTPLLGMLLNHMGLCSIELGEIQQALRFFEEAKSVMEETCGPLHLDTMDVCNNLASTYQAVGRYRRFQYHLLSVILMQLVVAMHEEGGKFDV